MSEAQASSGELIDFKKVRIDRLKRPSVVSFEQTACDLKDRSLSGSGVGATAVEPGSMMQGLDVEAPNSPPLLEALQRPVDPINKAIRDVEDRLTKELRDGIARHEPGTILRDLQTEVIQVRSRLDELNERIEQLCTSPVSRLDRDSVPPPTRDITALEDILADLARKIDFAIADRATASDVIAPIGEPRYERSANASFTRVEATVSRTVQDEAPALTWRGALFRTSRANRSDWADPARDHLDFLLDEYSPRGLYADIKAPGGDSGEKELERFGMGLERSLGTAAMAKEPASPWAVRQYSSGAEAQPRAGYAGVRWKISDQQRSEATQWVLFILVESARRTIRRGVAEIKSMQGRKFPDPALWMRHVPNEPPPAWMGGRERVSSLPSVSRASVLGVAGALFVICGYWLSRPSPNLINTVSPQVGAKPSAESGGSLKFGMALARANATEYATPSLVGGYVARPEVGAPLPNTFAANPSMNAGALRPKSAPNVEPSMSEAEVQALAAQGDPRAQYELATRLLMRQEKGPEAKVAAGWLEKAANQGFALAQLRLGILYGKGVGVNHDYALARKWFQAAAENGNALAMHNLAVLISEGHGRKPDPTSANAWFRKAAELGVVDSQYNLGLDYMDGLGVEKDLVQSYAWFAASAAAGDAKASKKRKEIAALLDPEELESARALANRLKQKQASMQADP